MELLVVIAIISLLIAILLPALSAARTAARKIQCGSTMRSIFFAMSAYETDERWYPTGISNVGYVMTDSTHIVMRNSYGLAEKHTICPNAGEYRANTYAWSSDGGAGRLTYWHGAGRGNLADGSSTTNGRLNSNQLLLSNGYYPRNSLQEVLKPSVHPYGMEIANPPGSFGSSPAAWNPLRANHPGPDGRVAEGQNVSYFDGHVAWNRLESQRSVFYLRRNGNDYAWFTPTMSLVGPTYVP